MFFFIWDNSSLQIILTFSITFLFLCIFFFSQILFTLYPFAFTRELFFPPFCLERMMMCNCCRSRLPLFFYANVHLQRASERASEALLPLAETTVRFGYEIIWLKIREGRRDVGASVMLAHCFTFLDFLKDGISLLHGIKHSPCDRRSYY